MRETKTAEIRDVRDGSKLECDLREWRDWYKARRVLFSCHLTLKNLIKCESEINKRYCFNCSLDACLRLMGSTRERKSLSGNKF